MRQLVQLHAPHTRWSTPIRRRVRWCSRLRRCSRLWQLTTGHLMTRQMSGAKRRLTTTHDDRVFSRWIHGVFTTATTGKRFTLTLLARRIATVACAPIRPAAATVSIIELLTRGTCTITNLGICRVDKEVPSTGIDMTCSPGRCLDIWIGGSFALRFVSR